MPFELVDYIGAHAAFVNNCNKSRSQLNVGDVFGNVAADSAVHLNYMSGIASARYVLSVRISFDVYKCCSDNYYACAYALCHGFASGVMSEVSQSSG